VFHYVDVVESWFGLYGPGWRNDPSWRPGWHQKSNLVSKPASKVQAATVQAADHYMTNIVKKTPALEPIITRNAGAVTRL
jgi:hypothetical protein